MAFEALQRISVLYGIEVEGKELTIEARKLLREEQSQPALADLQTWLEVIIQTP